MNRDFTNRGMKKWLGFFMPVTIKMLNNHVSLPGPGLKHVILQPPVYYYPVS
ncbi:hypothetical protein FB550_101729 [Neobacillus bataviensis]|uniref:Uncharacterized protein n=1 Tax=Neobacillus bataviensis TaxID=220685 RepID=A0A561DZE1_9BACI|nr:hypothetical protein FB550_101729 [Neobacillus bataviensis]